MIGKIVNVRCPACGGEMEIATSLKHLICYRRDLHPGFRVATVAVPVDLQLRIMHQPELPGLEMPEQKPELAAKGVTVVTW